MNLFNWKKKTVSKEVETEQIKQPEFTIEFYPLTNKYFPKYLDYFLYKDSTTGIVDTTTLMVITYSFNSEDKAKELINLFKEQSLKENIKIINVE